MHTFKIGRKSFLHLRSPGNVWLIVNKSIKTDNFIPSEKLFEIKHKFILNALSGLLQTNEICRTVPVNLQQHGTYGIKKSEKYYWNHRITRNSICSPKEPLMTCSINVFLSSPNKFLEACNFPVTFQLLSRKFKKLFLLMFNSTQYPKYLSMTLQPVIAVRQ